MAYQIFNVLAIMVISMNKLVVIGSILLLLTACSINEDVNTQASDTQSKSSTQKRHSTNITNINIVYQDENMEI